MRTGRPKSQNVYATLRKNFTTQALRAMRFVHDGSRMVKRGLCRTELAEATSLDGIWWRVRPFVRSWRHSGS